jgi:hypothetical protein
VSTAPTAAHRKELHRRGLWLEWETLEETREGGEDTE